MIVDFFSTQFQGFNRVPGRYPQFILMKEGGVVTRRGSMQFIHPR